MIRECIEKALGNVLGTGGSRAVLHHLEHEFDIKPEDLAYRPKEFVNALQEIFGPASIMIRKTLQRELLSDSCLVLRKYVKTIIKHLDY
jgi:hypothetical protein